MGQGTYLCAFPPDICSAVGVKGLRGSGLRGVVREHRNYWEPNRSDRTERLTHAAASED